MLETHDAIGVTFCIPNWNHRAFLPRSIRSAVQAARCLKKISVPSEILIIDDGSRDGSQRALLAMAMMQNDPPINVVILPENGGLGAARNLGLKRGSFRYICFLDADNEVYAENFSVFLRAIRDTSAAAVYGNLVRHDGTRVLSLISNDYIQDSFYKGNYVDAFALCDRQKLLFCGGFEETLTSHEDWEMYLHLLAEKESLVFVPTCMGYYYVNPHSMVQTQAFDHQRFFRIFNQRDGGLSGDGPSGRMFHPDIGWIR